jgi:ornithine cyclodeaminase
MSNPLWITESDVVSMMDMPAAIRALEAGLRAEARGAAINMTKTHVAWPVGETSPRKAGVDSSPSQGTLHAIGAAFPDDGFVGTKTWAHTPQGATPLVILYDSGTGALRAVIEAFAMGQLRTGAASGVATRMLARVDAAELAIVGTGKQALAQVAGVHVVRPLERVRVFGRDADRRRRFAERVKADLGLHVVEAASVAEAVNGAPIVTAITRAREPFLFAAMLARGAHLNAVGAIVPTGAEVAGDVLARCTRIVADSPEQARRLSRELIEFYGDDAAGWETVRRLADLVANGAHRTAADDLTLFKSLGMGVSDLSLGIEVYKTACRTGAGRPIESPQRAAPRLAINRENDCGV